MKTFVKLRISAKELNFEEINLRMKLKPNCICKKGDRVRSKFRIGEEIYNEDIWVYSMESREGESAETCFERFLEQIIPHASYVKKLSRVSSVTVWISIYPEETQTNIHLSVDKMSKIVEMGATIDIGMTWLKELYQ